MKIKRVKKFTTIHSTTKLWNVVVGISPLEEKIKLDRPQHPIQYIHIENYGFVKENEIEELYYLYKGIISNNNKQHIYIYVVNKNDIHIKQNFKPILSGLYLFNKDTGNDIWECLYFTKSFQNWKNKIIQIIDCKVELKNIFYALIGSNQHMI